MKIQNEQDRFDDWNRPTISDTCREYAANSGQYRPKEPWILTPYDTWERNPCYAGPEVPHPEYQED